ncbi:MAG: acetate kinase [Anaerolineae bacterium]
MILTINCGSSTIKYQLYTADGQQVAAKGVVGRIGEDGSYVDHQAQGQKVRHEFPIPTHHAAFEIAIQYLLHPQYGAMTNINEIHAVGHRAVHGADIFIESTIITPAVIEKLEECVPLAPLHNPPNLIGIREGRLLLPNVPHVAVFDTSFHQTMPPQAYVYALPYDFYFKHKIRKYGFHGTSCRYVSQRTAELLQRPISELKMVICHLGNGVTLAAVQAGQSVDTSIGFATFSGVMMGTRSGDIDPGLTFYLHRQLGLSLEEIERIYYKESGLLGVSGVSNDMRVVVERAQAGHPRCQLALEIFAYMTKKYIGAYAAAMGGINTLVFTAGIGENSPVIRDMVCEGLGFLGIELEKSKNGEAVGQEMVISRPLATTAVLVVPTDEEKMIALDTQKLAGLS